MTKYWILDHIYIQDAYSRIGLASLRKLKCRSSASILKISWNCIRNISVTCSANIKTCKKNDSQRWSQDIFPRQRHLPRHRCQDTRRAKTLRIRLRLDETETSFKCLRHETLQDTGRKTWDKPRHSGLAGDEIKTRLKCLRLRLCQSTVINTHCSHHKTSTTARTTVAVIEGDTVMIQLWDTRHDEIWKLKTEPRRDIQVSRLRQDRDMENHVSRQDTCLEQS